MSQEERKYYPFRYLHHYVYTVAFYGQNDPMIVKGPLVLRTYYKDSAKTIPDIKHTSDYYIDEIFYETNKVIRQQMDDGYSGKRSLMELSMPELGPEYRIIYNAAETPSDRYDDIIRLLATRDDSAHGVAIILRRDANKGIQYLTESEARLIADKLKER